MISLDWIYQCYSSHIVVMVTIFHPKRSLSWRHLYLRLHQSQFISHAIDQMSCDQSLMGQYFHTDDNARLQVKCPINGTFHHIEPFYDWYVCGDPIREVNPTPFTQITNRLTTSGSTPALNRLSSNGFGSATQPTYSNATQFNIRQNPTKSNISQSGWTKKFSFIDENSTWCYSCNFSFNIYRTAVMQTTSRMNRVYIFFNCPRSAQCFLKASTF